MSTAINGPVKGSGTHAALLHLQRMGGKASPADLMTQLVWDGSLARFQKLIIKPLEHERLVMRRDDLVTLTSRGATFLAPSTAAPAASAYVAPHRPLQARPRPAALSLRPGATDYRSIPSRIGEQIIAHGEKAVA
jgi:hypothetical protein